MTVVMSTEKQIELWRKELLEYQMQMKNFRNMNIRQIFPILSAYSARASEIRMRVVRSPESRAQSFRTQEVDHFLESVQTQFKIWSRQQALMTTEWEISQKD